MGTGDTVFVKEERRRRGGRERLNRDRGGWGRERLKGEEGQGGGGGGGRGGLDGLCQSECKRIIPIRSVSLNGVVMGTHGPTVHMSCSQHISVQCQEDVKFVPLINLRNIFQS